MELHVIETNDAFTHVKLIGRMDMQGATVIELAFKEQVAERGVSAIVDMSEVNFLASLGLRIILSNARILEKKGGRIIILNPQDVIRDVFDMAGLTFLIPHADTMGDARDMLRNPPADA